MGNFNDDTKIKTGFYHALGVVLTKLSNSPANEKYKSSHNISTGEIWGATISYCQLFSDAVNESNVNEALTMVGTPSTVILYPLQDSDNQSWFIDNGTPSWTSTGFVPSSGWVKPLVSPVDITDDAGAPSLGFKFQLWRPSNTMVSTSNGRWEIDYYAGLLKFQEGYTPIDPSNGLGFTYSYTDLASAVDKKDYLENNGPRAIAFQYSGVYLDYVLENLTGVYKVNSQKDIVTNTTTVDYDVAIDQPLQFEPAGDKSVDILVNGIEVNQTGYIFATPSSMVGLVGFTTGTNSVIVSDAQAPTNGYLNLETTGTVSHYRLIVGTLSSGGNTTITYSGDDVSAPVSVYKFDVTLRPPRIAKSGDLLLWVGSGASYELDPTDFLTLEYITTDSDADIA